MNTTETHPAQAYLEWCVTLKRAHGSETEAQFVGELLRALQERHQVRDTYIDCVGNLHALVGESTTMFTAHTDTVHSGGGVNDWSYTLAGTMVTGGRSALGADDGCGIAIMMHMIDNSISGRYTFFRGEECGGIGSKGIVRAAPEMFKGLNRAIAFDRAGLGDVITHQAGGRCCSDKFAQALADDLNVDGLMYLPDDTGVYTDTKEFTRLIPECTNLSVGYFSQHGPNETVNMLHFLELADRVLLVDWEALPTERSTAAPKKDEWMGNQDYMTTGSTKTIWGTLPTGYGQDYADDKLDDLYTPSDYTDEQQALITALTVAVDDEDFKQLNVILTTHSTLGMDVIDSDITKQFVNRRLPKVDMEELVELIDCLYAGEYAAFALDRLTDLVFGDYQ